MIEKIHIVIIDRFDALLRVHNEIRPYIVSPESEMDEYMGWGSLKIITEEKSFVYKHAINLCEKYNLHTAIFRNMHLTKKEIEDSFYFYIIPPHPLELDGYNEKYFGTILSGGCNVCNVGNKSKGDVLVDRKYIRNKKFVCLVPDFIVSKEVKEIIEANKLTGITFDRKVKDYKGREIEDSWVMDIHSVMPSFNESTSFFVEKHCPSCGYPLLLSRSDLRYNKDELVNISDFNLTKEYFNNYHMQGLIISKKALDVLKKNKIRFKAEPVILL